MAYQFTRNTLMTDKKSYIEEINKLSIYITEQYTNVTVDTVRFG